MIKPFNDHLLVELEVNQWSVANEQGEEQDPKAGYGVVVDIPDIFGWLSSYTWVADNTVGNEEYLQNMRKIMKDLVGKKVYFEQRAEIGNVIEDGDKKYAVIKLSKITGVAE